LSNVVKNRPERWAGVGTSLCPRPASPGMITSQSCRSGCGGYCAMGR